MLVQNCLVGTGLRPHIKIGASGKITNGFDIVKRITRAPTSPLGARHDVRQRLHPGDEVPHQPLPHRGGHPGPRAGRALNVPDKIDRVANSRRRWSPALRRWWPSMGLESFSELTPSMLNRHIDYSVNRTYAEIYEWLMPGELLTARPRPGCRTGSRRLPKSSCEV